MHAALPEIPESEATGITAEIYEDIRQSLDVKNVNLIYRYFATIDGGLPWAWGLVKPHFASGELKKCAQASRLRYRINSPTSSSLTCPNLADIERKSIAETLDFYLTANPMNLFALQILNKALATQPIKLSGTHNGLLPLAEIRQAATSQQFESTSRELMFYVSQGLNQVRPTLLRQLATWPEYVDAIAEFVRTISCEDDFENQTESTYEYAAHEINDFYIANIEPLPNRGALEEIAQFCDYFPRLLIRMTMIADRLRMML